MAMERNLRDLSGTRDFAEALAEQERALGLVLAPTPPEPEPQGTDATDLVEPAAAHALPPLAAPAVCDAFGNTILGAPGPLGQVRIASARDGCILRVCGEAATTAHLWAWDYDEGERRFVCAVCWGQALSAPDAE